MSFCCPFESKADIDKIDDAAIDLRRNANDNQTEDLSVAPATETNHIHMKTDAKKTLAHHLTNTLLQVYDGIKSAESFTMKEKHQLLEEEVRNKDLKMTKSKKNHLKLLVPKFRFDQQKERKKKKTTITS